MNISVDPDTYERLTRLTNFHNFKNVSELVVSCVHLLLDRLAGEGGRKYDLPEEDGAYIDNMFDELGHTERTPDGRVPVRHHRKSIQ